MLSGEWIAQCLKDLADRNASTIEALPSAEADWGRRVAEVSDQFIYKDAPTWYMGANIPGKPRVFLLYAGGVGAYRLLCQDIVDQGYVGFAIS